MKRVPYSRSLILNSLSLQFILTVSNPISNLQNKTRSPLFGFISLLGVCSLLTIIITSVFDKCWLQKKWNLFIKRGPSPIITWGALLTYMEEIRWPGIPSLKLTKSTHSTLHIMNTIKRWKSVNSCKTFIVAKFSEKVLIPTKHSL